MKPFLLLATRDHDRAAQAEYESVRKHAGLATNELMHLRVEAGPLPQLDLDDYSGILLGGSSLNVSDTEKSPHQHRVEADLMRVVKQVVDADYPFFGMCYGVGTVTSYLGGTVDRTYGESVGGIEVTLTNEGVADPVTAGMPRSFHAFVGHKEASNGVPPRAALLATGEVCPVQMYRVGENVYVTQFHPELDASDLAERMRIYQHAGYFDPSELDTLIEMAQSAGVTGAQHKILHNFVERYAS